MDIGNMPANLNTGQIAVVEQVVITDEAARHPYLASLPPHVRKGSKPVPSIKIASNSRLFHNMRDDMDLDAGLVLAGEESVDSMGRIILDAVIATASGQQTKSELNGYGDEEFTPWHVGALL